MSMRTIVISYCAYPVGMACLTLSVVEFRRPAFIVSRPAMRSIRPLVVAALACAAFAASAQHTLEIIPLRHATVEQVIPALRPLLDPGGTLTGQRGQLIVRTSPGNLDEIRRALAAIDRPARRLQILVRFDDAAETSRQEIGASGRISNR